jgi:hypothetical protein
MARRNKDGVRLYTRNGYDFAGRFPQIVEAVAKLKVHSCFIDGEAIVLDEHGLSAFDLLRSWRHDHAAVLCWSRFLRSWTKKPKLEVPKMPLIPQYCRATAPASWGSQVPGNLCLYGTAWWG